MNEKLGFGTLRLPLKTRKGTTRIDLGTLEQMVDTFLEHGFGYFDTAPMYAGGAGEEALRRTLVERYPRSAFRLVDKLPTLQLSSAGEQARCVEAQLRRCGVDRFDRYLVHCATAAFWERAEKLGSFGFVRRLREEGVVGKAGFSFHDSPELLEEILDHHPWVDFVQLQINYMDWERPPISARRCYEVAARHGKPVVAMCPLKGGLLARLPQAVRQRLSLLRPEASPAEWAMRFVASLPAVETVLSGLSSMEELNRNIALMEHLVPLDTDQRQLLDEAARLDERLTPIQCTRCGYCLEVCPKALRIPSDLWMLNDLTAGTVQAAAPEAANDAAACTGCRRCESACPQHLPISAWMQVAAVRLAPGPGTTAP